MRSDRSRDARQHPKARLALSDLLQKVTLVPARSFWSIVLATLLLADKAMAAESALADNEEGAQEDVDTLAAGDLAVAAEPSGAEAAVTADAEVPLHVRHQTQVGAQTLQAEHRPTSAAEVVPLSDEALARLVQKWLGMGGAHAAHSTEVAGGAPARPTSASSSPASTVQEARQSFRELLQCQRPRAGVVVVGALHFLYDLVAAL